MRTTLSLDDDVFREVKAYAESRDVAIGKAVSELVRRGLHAPLQTRLVNGFCTHPYRLASSTAFTSSNFRLARRP